MFFFCSSLMITFEAKLVSRCSNAIVGKSKWMLLSLELPLT